MGRPVALRKESVDRNVKSRSALAVSPVALRKESVDRNGGFTQSLQKLLLSLSARRAWIEITVLPCRHSKRHVALRKESVDRNLFEAGVVLATPGRSPQGERG